MQMKVSRPWHIWSWDEATPPIPLNSFLSWHRQECLCYSARRSGVDLHSDKMETDQSASALKAAGELLSAILVAGVAFRSLLIPCFLASAN